MDQQPAATLTDPAISPAPVTSGESLADADNAAPLKPVTARTRIESIDTLRGVAVLGILAMNIYAFAMPFQAYNNPLIWGGDGALSRGVWYLTHFLFDQKFLPVFSMLFGAGLILMFERADGRSITRTWYRRNLWLLLIGALHAYLLWFGDILFTYAFLGLLLFPLRRLKPKTLIIFGALWLLPALAMSTLGGIYQSKAVISGQALDARVAAGETLTGDEVKEHEIFQAQRAWLAPTADDIEHDVEVYRSDYPSMLGHRAPTVLMMQTVAILFFGLWRMGGLMLIGMGLMKLGVFSAERDDAFYRRLLVAGYALGLPLVAISAWVLTGQGWAMTEFQISGVHWNYIGSILVALGHISVVMLACRRGWFAGLRRRFSAVGRMALTNYLMQSVICTFVFYGYGLGLYGHLERPAQMAIVAAVWIAQLLYSPWWLARFRFGPVEWIWRSLTYGKVPKLKRLPAA